MPAAATPAPPSGPSLHRKLMAYLSSVAVFVLAGGKGTRLHELTEGTCKPALPFAGSHRIIDWTLTNVKRSGLSRIIVATQHNPNMLRDHLAAHWEPAFRNGQFAVLDGRVAAACKEGFRGTADAVAHCLKAMERLQGSEVLVLGADHIYEMDFRLLLAAHRASGAKATVAAHPAPLAEAHAFRVLSVDDSGRVVRFDEKPARPAAMADDPGHALCSMGIYVFDRLWLLGALREIAKEPETRHDFGRDILPRALRDEGLYACRARHPDPSRPFYWRDVGTLDAFRTAHLELAASPAPCALARRVEESWMALPSKFADRHGNALMQGASLSPQAQVRNTILGPGLHLPAGVRIGYDAQEDAQFFRVTDEGTVLVTPQMYARYARAHPPVYSAASRAPDVDAAPYE